MPKEYVHRCIAVIGTAGRDKERVMDASLWRRMTEDLSHRINPADVLISGGAAWADHLAVHAYLHGWCSKLYLFLPAPFQGGHFLGGFPSSGNTANYYHKKFVQCAQVDGLKQIEQAIAKGAIVESEPVSASYAGMFARNKKVAAHATAAIAYTYGIGLTPADGGTLGTWKQIKSDDKIHVSLYGIN